MTIAFWCVLIAALLPYVPFALVSSKVDMRAPRKGERDLEGLAARALGAHLNAFETFPPFAAAVIVAHLVEGASATVNVLAVLYIVARLAHTGFYLADKAKPRSASFTIGMILMVVIFVQPAFH